MNIPRGFTLAALMTLAAGSALAGGFSLNDAANAISSMQGGDEAAAAPTSQAAALLDTLGSQLNITPQQAIGGAGAMFSLAKNQLSSADYSQLSKSVPGLDRLSGRNVLGALGGLLGQSSADTAGLDSALGNVKDANDLNNAFDALGLDSGMIGRFAPLILQYLGQQGVGGSLLQSLSGIWGVGG
ncbi:DUF2780 domain-containing protein [Pseudomonas sp. LD120]|uniref:DUF2780 domain-containing protein n=1 Tax=Pseudomonas sp. LD120 TaxID=485751 RepID=UPI00135724D7|nr:DUF2780 domain-containing protein [Pseudomonas sp. LD120]KAF0867262.1 DUF2780 domain-containing protein [Pseudomonas sp. LD120]